MNITSLVFSPTSETARVARTLTSVWKKVHYTQIDLTKDDYPYESLSFEENDVCYTCFPVYEGRVPKIVLDRLSRMKAAGAPLVIVAVYGNQSNDDALLEMKNEATAMGFCPVAAVAAVAERTVLRHRAAGRPDEWDIAELEQFGEIIRARILSKEKLEIEVPGKYLSKPQSDEEKTVKKWGRKFMRLLEGRRSNNLYI